jgi:predicted aldo/keto reductase-like oxidoreductase
MLSAARLADGTNGHSSQDRSQSAVEPTEATGKCPQNIPIIEMLAKAHAHLTGSWQIGSKAPSHSRVNQAT